MSFFILILDKPVFVNSNLNSKISVREGEQFSISCVAHANPPSITYHWMKDEKLLGNFVNNASLTLPKVNRQDAGRYTCEAENAEGFDRLLVDLLVLCKNKHVEHDKNMFLPISFLYHILNFVFPI